MPITEEERARAYLLRLFQYRPRSCYEVWTRLRQKGFSQKIIESVVSQAERAGILDDAKFAQLWVEDRLARRPRSRRMLERELQAQGVAREHIERALARAQIDEESLARRLLSEKLARLRALDPKTRQRRVMGFLRRRGFSESVIARALRSCEEGGSGSLPQE